MRYVQRHHALTSGDLTEVALTSGELKTSCERSCTVVTQSFLRRHVAMVLVSPYTHLVERMHGDVCIAVWRRNQVEDVQQTTAAENSAVPVTDTGERTEEDLTRVTEESDLKVDVATDEAMIQETTA